MTDLDTDGTDLAVLCASCGHRNGQHAEIKCRYDKRLGASDGEINTHEDLLYWLIKTDDEPWPFLQSECQCPGFVAP